MGQPARRHHSALGTHAAQPCCARLVPTHCLDHPPGCWHVPAPVVQTTVSSRWCCFVGFLACLRLVGRLRMPTACVPRCLHQAQAPADVVAGCLLCIPVDTQLTVIRCVKGLDPNEPGSPLRSSALSCARRQAAAPRFAPAPISFLWPVFDRVVSSYRACLRPCRRPLPPVPPAPLLAPLCQPPSWLMARASASLLGQEASHLKCNMCHGSVSNGRWGHPRTQVRAVCKRRCHRPTATRRAGVPARDG